jgi:hypothetical protein
MLMLPDLFMLFITPMPRRRHYFRCFSADAADAATFSFSPADYYAFAAFSLTPCSPFAMPLSPAAASHCLLRHYATFLRPPPPGHAAAISPRCLMPLMMRCFLSSPLILRHADERHCRWLFAISRRRCRLLSSIISLSLLFSLMPPLLPPPECHHDCHCFHTLMPQRAFIAIADITPYCHYFERHFRHHYAITLELTLRRHY